MHYYNALNKSIKLRTKKQYDSYLGNSLNFPKIGIQKAKKTKERIQKEKLKLLRKKLKKLKKKADKIIKNKKINKNRTKSNQIAQKNILKKRRKPKVAFNVKTFIKKRRILMKKKVRKVVSKKYNKKYYYKYKTAMKLKGKDSLRNFNIFLALHDKKNKYKKNLRFNRYGKYKTKWSKKFFKYGIRIDRKKLLLNKFIKRYLRNYYKKKSIMYKRNNINPNFDQFKLNKSTFKKNSLKFNRIARKMHYQNNKKKMKKLFFSNLSKLPILKVSQKFSFSKPFDYKLHINYYRILFLSKLRRKKKLTKRKKYLIRLRRITSMLKKKKSKQKLKNILKQKRNIKIKHKIRNIIKAKTKKRSRFKLRNNKYSKIGKQLIKLNKIYKAKMKETNLSIRKHKFDYKKKEKLNAYKDLLKE